MAVAAEAAALAGVATGDVTVLFVTHSIPSAMDAASGPRGVAGSAEGLGYTDQHRRVAAEVVRLADEGAGDWELVFCSRSGAPHMPWLEPDVNDRLAELAASGAKAVVAAPIGFVNDHMEVVFDLDTQGRATAAALGLPYVRAATAGVHPGFVAELAEAIATGSLTPGSVAGYPACRPGCCASGRPGAPGAPAAPAAWPRRARPPRCAAAAAHDRPRAGARPASGRRTRARRAPAPGSRDWRGRRRCHRGASSAPRRRRWAVLQRA